MHAFTQNTHGAWLRFLYDDITVLCVHLNLKFSSGLPNRIPCNTRVITAVPCTRISDDVAISVNVFINFDKFRLARK